MKKRKIMKKALSILLIMVMILGTSITGFAATTFSDINGHWASASINYGVSKGFIKGYADGTFKPDSPVSRAEFSKMLNVAFGVAITQAVSFKDVVPSEWYYQEVRKALAAGFINGYEDNTFRPNGKITRQEAAIMIAGVVPATNSAPSLAGLSDNASIADWARAAVTKVYAKGYMRGDDKNRYNPTKSLTRAEAATILSSIVSKETIISADTTISNNGLSIADTIYSNNLTISKTLGTGSFELRDSMVLGTMSVLSGGTSSIAIYDTNIHNMSVAKTTGDVRVFLSGDSAVKDTVVENGAILEHKSLRGLGFQTIYFNGTALATQEVSLIGSFNQIYVNTAATIKATSGTISNVTVTREASGDAVKLGGTYTNVTFEAKTLFELLTGKITALTVNSGASSSRVKLNSGTSISTAVVDGTKTAFTGSGTIARLEANVNDITYEAKPTRIVTAGSVSRPPLLSADTTAPAPTFVPASSATNILGNTKIAITFDEPIYKSNGNPISTSSTASTLADIHNIIELREISSTGTLIAYTATISSDKKIITLTPDAVLANNTNYYIIIVSGTIEDAAGNQNSKITSSFKTGTTDVAAPVPAFTPANGAANVALDSNIVITFNENVYNSAGNLLTTSNLSASTIILKIANANGANVPYSATVTSSRTITINPEGALTSGTYYVAIKGNTLEDAAGNLVPLTSITFTTVGTTIAITGVTLSQNTVPDLEVGPGANSAKATVQLTATVAPSTATDKTVTWQSGNTAIAAINASGLVTAIGEGTTTITVRSVSDTTKTATCQITVTNIPPVAVSGVTLDQISVTDLQVGPGANSSKTTVQLVATVLPLNATYKAVTWTTSNAAAATVSQNGVVTAVGAGNATITVTSDVDNTKAAICNVTVTYVPAVAITGVSLNFTSILDMQFGPSATKTSVQLIATVSPSDATNQSVSWTSSNPAVASVNASTGFVMSTGAGTVIITAQTADGGQQATCNITVTLAS